MHASFAEADMSAQTDCKLCQKLGTLGPCALHRYLGIGGIAEQQAPQPVCKPDLTAARQQAGQSGSASGVGADKLKSRPSARKAEVSAGGHLSRAGIVLFGGGGMLAVIVLASGGHLTERGTGHLTGTGWLVIISGIGLFCGVVAEVRQALGLPETPLPKEPRTDFSPVLYDLLGGTKHDSYTAPIRAVTPGGLTVTHSRCCPRGHLSPRQAIEHAAVIKERIERTGR
jgi:hypothetical protein